MGQNLVPLVNIKIAGKWMFIPLKMVLIGIDPYPYRGKLNTAADTGVPLLWNRFSSGCADPGIICARKDLWWRQLGDNIWEVGNDLGYFYYSCIFSNIEIYPLVN